MTQADRLAEEIAEAVISGEFRPGFRLDEHMLAERYQVSRTPVREALRQLATTGLIDIKPRCGATVSTPSAGQLETLFGAMAEAEATCARLAAMSMTPIERRRLDYTHEGMSEFVERDDQAGFAAANLGFHSLIYDGAHNKIITDFAIGLRRRLTPYRRAQFRGIGRLPCSQAEHGAVVRAILGGDAQAAHNAMFLHMSLVEEAFERVSAGVAVAFTRAQPRRSRGSP